MLPTMPRPSRLRLKPLNLGRETFGQRLARLRHERGLTQTELAERVGLIQTLVSAYEHDQLRLRVDVAARLAIALGISADELLGLKGSNTNGGHLSRRVLRRMQRVEQLAPTHQRALLKTIDAYIRGVGPDSDGGQGR